MRYFVMYNSPFHAGGVEQVVANIIRALPQAERMSYSVVCSTPDQPREFFFDGVKCYNINSPRLSLLDTLLRLDRFVYSYRAYKFLLRKQNRGDIINIHGIEYSLLFRIRRRNFNGVSRIIISVHGSFFDAYTQYVVKSLPARFFLAKMFFYFFRWYYYILERWSINSADEFTFITTYLQEFYMSRYGVIRPPRVIYNGIRVVHKHHRPISSKRGAHALIVGSSLYGKGLDVALRTCSELRADGFDITLTVVGFPGHRKQVAALPYVHYAGNQPPERMGEFYEQADLLLLPSRNEGFPLVVLEALCHGLPVVVSGSCRFEEIPGYGDFGLIVASFGTRDWATAVRDTAHEASWVRRNKAIEAHDFSIFSSAHMGEQYLSIYDGV